MKKTGSCNVLCVMCNAAVLLFTLHVTQCACVAQPANSTELISNAALYDGRVVIFAGEAVGEIMPRGDFAWVNLNDGVNAIGCWIDRGFTRQIALTGGSRVKGDWVEVIGIFHRACPEHGGDLDIHVQNLNRVRAGRVVVQKANQEKRNQVFILAGALCLVLILRLLKRLPRRK